MPAPAGTKRVKGIQIHRPFVFGSLARPFSASNPRPPNVPSEHTHSWMLYIRPITPQDDLSHWLKKAQFKLHETYAQNTRIVETPSILEVHETGWGEFEVQIKLFFAPESGEKAGTLWHALKLHPYGDEKMKEEQIRKGEVRSECYEEVIFTEPVEQFYDILVRDTLITAGGGGGGRGKYGGKSGKGVQARRTTAEIPDRESKDNPFSQEREAAEVQRMKDALKEVEGILKKEKDMLFELEKKKDKLIKEAEQGDAG